MQTDKIKSYLLEIILTLILVFTLFELNGLKRMILAIILWLILLITSKTLKKRKVLTLYKNECGVELTIFAIIYVVALYVIGIFTGFYNSPIKLSIWSLKTYTIPIAFIIIASEKLRYILTSQKGKWINAFCFIDMVLIDLILYLPNYNLKNLDEFLMSVGFLTFASISENLLYNYITNRFGSKPVIIYRLITTLYIYIIPLRPDIYIYFHTILKMLVPYIIYLILEYTFQKKIESTSKLTKKKNILFYSITIVLALSITMLISNKFTYGIMVVGSGSMTGSLNKGDATIFKSYNHNKDNITNGDIILFKKDDEIIIHRVIKKTNINNKTRYYTKGDNNQSEDEDYRLDEDIVGIAKIRIPYIGYPTIWLKEQFSNN